MSTATMKRGNRALKGAIAAGGATAVLLGGFGAFSLWSDSESLGVTGDLESGVLEVATATSPTPGWTLTDTDGVLPVGSTVNPSTYVASPGDVLTYNATLEVTLGGDDLVADLSVDESSVVAAPAAGDVDVAISSSYTPGGTVPGTPPTGAIRLIGDNAGTTISVPVEVVIDFHNTASNATANPNASQGQNLVDLDGLAFDLDQVSL